MCPLITGAPGLIAALAALAACSDPTPRGGGNLLSRRAPSRVMGVSSPARITDGIVSAPGAHWQTEQTSVLASSASFVEYDLGGAVLLRCAYLQADANETYVVTASADGEAFKPLWRAAAALRPGMQTRRTCDLRRRARYIRLYAAGGDGRYSVGELALYPGEPDPWPPKMREAGRRSLAGESHRAMIMFGVLAALFLALGRRRPRLTLLLSSLPAAGAALVVIRLRPLWPADEAQMTLLRAVIAAVAGILLLREYFLRRWIPADRRWTAGAVIALATLSVSLFYHLGVPQFMDAGKQRRTMVHLWDMRVYYPVAKYFEELRYDGLYLASVAAFLDCSPNVSAADIGEVRLRDLRTNEVRRVKDVTAEISAVRSRFTPRRWRAFREDMRYFLEAMGTAGYLGSLIDHGGNATPTWILAAHALFRWTRADELTLTLTGLIDPLLLAALFVVIGRTYGARTALLCLIIFGTTDFSRFGTNLVGSTLRYDWIAALGLGACALRTGRPALGGVLLAYGGLARAFPALSAVFLAAPALWRIIERRRRRAAPTDDGAAESRSLRRAVAGGLIAAAVLVTLSAALFSLPGSWGRWWDKITIHAAKHNTNSVGLRNVMSYRGDRTGPKVIRRDLAEPWTDWQRYQRETLKGRRGIHVAALVLFVALALLACRGGGLDRAALCGALMIPVLFYPANYYVHFVFLLPLVAVPRAGPPGRLFAWTGIVICAMSVAQYPTLQQAGADVCFTQQSVILLCGVLAILLPLARRGVGQRPAGC